MELTRRSILITGGGSGIGLELARHLVESNHVVVAGRDPAKLERAVADVKGLRATELDVTSEESSRSAVADAVRLMGGLDILVNSAGILRATPFEDDVAGRAMDEEIAVNLIGALRMTRLALPHLHEAEDGAVVFLSSALALTAAPGLTAYAATKAAVHSIARSLRAELAPEVKVFDVLPPFVDTDLAARVGRTKLSPNRVATDILDGLRRDHFEIRIGRVQALAVINGLWPSAADRIVAGELKTDTGHAVADPISIRTESG